MIPHTLEGDRVQSKDLKMVHCFSGSEMNKPFNWRTCGGCSSWKFNSSDSKFLKNEKASGDVIILNLCN